MAVMAKWRDKTFGVSTKKVNPISNLTTSAEAKGKDSKSKKKYTELVPVTFDVELVSGLGITPQTEYESWVKLIKKKGQIYLHGRKFGRETRLTKVTLSNVTTDDFGRIRMATMGLTFEEVNVKETKNTKASKIAATKEEKVAKKKKRKKGKKVTIKVGSKVRLTGTYYVDGEKILASSKKRNMTVGKINDSKVYIAEVQAWVYKDTLSLVK